MTQKQSKLLSFINGYTLSKGFPPTLYEMRKFMKVKALSTIHQHLEALRWKKYIYQDRKWSPRSYYINAEAIQL